MERNSKDKKLELAIVHEAVECLSDGAGTNDRSNIGVPAPNSDGETDALNTVGRRTKKNIFPGYREEVNVR